jgi:hypothetical protein
MTHPAPQDNHPLPVEPGHVMSKKAYERLMHEQQK